MHLDLEDLVEQTLLRTMEALAATDAYAAIIQPDGKLFERAVRGKIQHKPENSVEHSLSVHVATTRQGIIISDAGVEAQWDLPLNGKTRSLIAAPLLGRKDVIGVLTLTHERASYFRPEHLVLLQAISSQAAMAIENAQLYTSEHKRVQELVALNMLTRQISSFTNSNTLLDTFPSLMQSTLGYPMVTLWLNRSAQGQAIRLKLHSHASAADIEFGDEDSLQLAPQQAASNNRAVLVSGLVANSPAGKIKTGQLKLNSHTFRSVAAVPFLLQGSLAGVLAVHSPNPGQIQDSDRVVLETLASQVASALERIHLFESVNHEQRRLAAVLDSAADAILMFDQDECLLITNPAGVRLFTDIDARIGHPLPAGKGYDELIEMLKQAKEDESGLSGEASWPDGRTFMISIAPVKQGGWVVVLSDVSHFKALDKLKNEFIATASHDLKNPLTTVMGFSDLIDRAGPLNEMQSDFLKRIQHAAKHMHELVINLLEMARMEMGIELDLEDVDINQLLTAIEDEFRPQAAMKNHQLKLDLIAGSLMVRGDLKRLQQVARNLVGNAIKYTPDGGVVTISSQVENGEVRVAIKDTGIGIPAEALPNLFQKFYRVRCEQTENIEGNGLGLAIVKSIVERHNGSISVISAPGKGSTFLVTIPQIIPV
jgi:signal transduction histidine kinase